MILTVEELKAKLDAKEDFLLIDVREPYEYEEFNIGAKLIPLGNIISAAEELEAWKEKEVVIHCRSGARSAAAQEILLSSGYKKVFNLEGGILAWKERIVQ